MKSFTLLWEIYTQICCTFCCWNRHGKSSIQRGEVSFHQQKALRLQSWTGPEGSRRLRLPDFIHQQTGLKFREETSKVFQLVHSFCIRAETWILWKVDQKQLESFEMWCWRRMQKISWTDRVRDEDVLHRVKQKRNIVQTIKRRKTNWLYGSSSPLCLINYVGFINCRTQLSGGRCMLFITQVSTTCFGAYGHLQVE